MMPNQCTDQPQMNEYFAALEVCKQLYGVNDEEYFNVSSTMANLFMNM